MPAPSFFGDPELEALFPTEIGGAPVRVRIFGGADVRAQSADMAATLEALLAAHGKTLDDFSIGNSDSPDPMYTINAIRVKGTDVNAVANDVLPPLGISAEAMAAAATPTQIAGKDVLEITSGFLYPKDDIMWRVGAEEPILTEVMQKLP